MLNIIIHAKVLVWGLCPKVDEKAGLTTATATIELN